MRGSAMSARAIAARCFCPPDSVIPRSPTIVSNPSGNEATSLSSRAMPAAHSIRARSADFAPPCANAMLSAIDSEKRNASCGTNPMARRRAASGRSRTSTPSMNTVPGGGSNSRGSRLMSVDFPDPVGPTSATVSPASIFTDTRSSTVWAP